MSVRSQVTKMNMAILIAAAIAADGTTNGEPVDGADNELGLSFFMSINGTVAGNFTLSLEDSADDGAGAPLGDWTAIPANQIIHGGSDFPPDGGVTEVANTGAITVETAVGDNMAKIGVFSERRWVRPIVVAAGTATADDLIVAVVKHSEYLAA